MNESDFFSAVYKNDANSIIEYINSGFDPNSADSKSGHTALQLACQADKLISIETLVNNGANPRKKFTKISRIDGHIIYKDAVALMCVESIDAAKILLDNGADLNDIDANGWTALVHAIHLHNYRLVNFLVDAGSNINVGFVSKGKIIDLNEFINQQELFIRELMGYSPNEHAIQALKDYEQIRDLLDELKK